MRAQKVRKSDADILVCTSGPRETKRPTFRQECLPHTFCARVWSGITMSRRGARTEGDWPEWHSIKVCERPRSETATPVVGWECLAEVTPPCPRTHLAKLPDGMAAAKATRHSNQSGSRAQLTLCVCDSLCARHSQPTARRRIRPLIECHSCLSPPLSRTPRPARVWLRRL